MSFIRRAVIDVGTNSVKLLVAETGPGGIVPVHEESRQTRLGKGFYTHHRLQPDAIRQTAAAVALFAAAAREQQAVSIRVIATSAARDALNAEELTAAIHTASGLRTEIIPGEQEAEWAFQGVAACTELAEEPLLLLDAGGGSTEFILGHRSHKSFALSFPLGTVRLMEKFPVSNPPSAAEQAACRDWLRSFIHTEVRPQIEAPLRAEQREGTVQLVGTGGTATLLACIENQLTRFDREAVERTVLSAARVTEIREQLWGLPLAERGRVPGLPAQRADVILTGALLLETVMAEFGFPELRVSTRGLRFAAVLEP